MPDNRVIIRVEGLVNVLGGNLLHDHVDFEVRRGEVMGVVGGSGTGKSVLLRTIIGLNRPKSGTIRIFGQDTAKLDGNELRALQRRWGVLFQDGALFSSQTVAENIQLPLREHTDVPQALMDEIASLKLSMVGLPLGHRA